ncbi:MAG: isochorismatase family protein [Syntrophales bacterium]
MTTRAAEEISVQKGDALIVVDMQNCFLPGGVLGVSSGDEVIGPLNRLIRIFQEKNLPVFFSRDWHPANHCSFHERGGPWPPHCVQNTEGAEFSPALAIPAGAIVFSKGTDPDMEEYSAWLARDNAGRSLRDHVLGNKIERLFVGGLATDYCVLNTVKDALREGHRTYILTDAVRAVNVNPGDAERAFKEMTAAGGVLITSKTVRA